MTDKENDDGNDWVRARVAGAKRGRLPGGSIAKHSQFLNVRTKPDFSSDVDVKIRPSRNVTVDSSGSARQASSVATLSQTLRVGGRHRELEEAMFGLYEAAVELVGVATSVVQTTQQRGHEIDIALAELRKAMTPVTA